MARTGENIYKRKDGRWEARLIVSYDIRGKAKYKYLYARTYSEAKQKLLTAHSSNSSVNRATSMGREKYDYWLSKWLSLKRTAVKSSTYIRYKNMIDNHIKPSLGDYPINRISTTLIEDFVLEKIQFGRLDGNGGLSSKTVSDILVVIKETLKYAVREGAPVNYGFDRIPLKKNNQNMRVLSISEQKNLVSILSDRTDKYKMGVFICLYTGIRIGELCALKWKNVSLKEKVIKVECTLQRLQNDEPGSITKTVITVTEPKSTASLRVIPLPDFVINIMAPFAGPDNCFILSGKSDVAVEPRTMQNRFKSYIAEAGIDNANFHCLRHTFATRCIEAGFDEKTLSDILGHSSVKITLDRYVHSSLQLKRNNMEKLSL